MFARDMSAEWKRVSSSTSLVRVLSYIYIQCEYYAWDYPTLLTTPRLRRTSPTACGVDLPSDHSYALVAA